MKIKQLFILFPLMFAMVVMLASCQARTISPWPPGRVGAIATTAIEVTGDLNKGEKLRIEFEPDGSCKQTFVGKDNEPTNCKGLDLKKDTFFCIKVDDKSANTNIYGKIKVYCGNVLELTDGADIQFKASSSSGNTKCKNVGGDVICY